ncbi:TetR/AcrR family transcriptional regulator [Streptomyces sp. NPDC048111]|uniref:TetR/AcrR family transcriptional regulator n=1 Tax=Streptomyces sp. NPDC048111 TaxID=3365500 RepID=UPI00371A3BA1
MADDSKRPLRADAQRNRDRILTTAARMFAERGLDTHLEHIAKEAGVGIGTLYRNFPTRDALVEAAYRNELARLCDAAPELLAALPPREALRAWMGRLLDYASAKQGMADALRSLAAQGAAPHARSRELIQDALASLMDAAVGAGTIRADLTSDDLFVGLTGIALAAAGPEQREQAERLLDLTMDGLTTRPR